MNETRQPIESSTEDREYRAGTYQSQCKKVSELVHVGAEPDSMAKAGAYTNRLTISTGQTAGITIHIVVRDNSSAAAIIRANKLLSGDKD